MPSRGPRPIDASPRPRAPGQPTSSPRVRTAAGGGRTAPRPQRRPIAMGADQGCTLPQFAYSALKPSDILITENLGSHNSHPGRWRHAVLPAAYTAAWDSIRSSRTSPNSSPAGKSRRALRLADWPRIGPLHPAASTVGGSHLGNRRERPFWPAGGTYSAV
jgi:hypothetical protein